MKRKRRTKTRLLPMYELHARPCEVNGRRALFHRWHEGHTVEGYELRALVEYRDGTVALVKPETLRFTNRARYINASQKETHTDDKRTTAKLPKD